MSHRWELGLAGSALLMAMVVFLPTNASAISVELAKKCNTLVAKEFPPREAGNPAAGSAKGSGREQRDFFKKCVDNGGNVETTTNNGSK